VDEAAQTFHYRLDDGVRQGPAGERLDEGADEKADPAFLASLDKMAAFPDSPASLDESAARQEEAGQ
jgi:hypothetical protein